MVEKDNSSSISCASCDVETDQKICMNKEGTGSRGCPTLTRRDVLAAVYLSHAYYGKIKHPDLL